MELRLRFARLRLTPPNGIEAVTPEVLDRARRGDAKAFATLYEAYSPRVHALALRLVGDRGEAVEVVQDAFVRIWQKLGGFRGESALGTWIHRLAVNVVLERRRSERRRLERVALTGEPESLGSHTRPVPVDERLDLDRALATLSEPARTVFVLREIEGYEYAELSELLGTTEVALRAQLYRARKRLLEVLDA